MKNTMNRKNAIVVSGVLLVIIGAATLLLVSVLPAIQQLGEGGAGIPLFPTGVLLKERSEKLAKFGSDEEFRKYLAESRESQAGGFGIRGDIATMEMSVMSSDMLGSPKAMSSVAEAGRVGGNNARVSGTNVQVVGIDEPDIVKTDGTSIYFSREPDYSVMDSPMPMVEKRAAAGMEISMLAPGDMTIAPDRYAPKGQTGLVDFRLALRKDGRISLQHCLRTRSRR